MEKNLVQMLPLAVELLRSQEELCDLYIWVCCVPSVGEQLPLFWGAVQLRRRNRVLLPVGCVVAPHRQANAKAGQSTTFKFFMVYMKVSIEMVFSVYI